MEHLKDVSLGKFPASLANIKLSSKGISGTNTLAYYLVNYGQKSFITLAPGLINARKASKSVPFGSYSQIFNLASNSFQPVHH